MQTPTGFGPDYVVSIYEKGFSPHIVPPLPSNLQVPLVADDRVNRTFRKLPFPPEQLRIWTNDVTHNNTTNTKTSWRNISINNIELFGIYRSNGENKAANFALKFEMENL